MGPNGGARVSVQDPTASKLNEEMKDAQTSKDGERKSLKGQKEHVGTDYATNNLQIIQTMDQKNKDDLIMK